MNYAKSRNAVAIMLQQAANPIVSGSVSTILSVIPAEAGIQDSWMPDRVRHDKARASADFFQPRCHFRERLDSRYTIFNFGLIPTKLLRSALGPDDSGFNTGKGG
jgi:hypothetical protein